MRRSFFSGIIPWHHRSSPILLRAIYLLEQVALILVRATFGALDRTHTPPISVDVIL